MANDSIWKSWEFTTIVYVAIVIAVILGGSFTYNALSKTQDSADIGPAVKLGDTVSVNYIGMFEDGTIFDTSIQSVAENDTLYPKSLSFSSSAPFNPLSFTVGEGQMIKGFDNGVIGMSVNQTRLLTIPMEDAYGPSDEGLIQTRQLVETIPVFEWMENYTEFQDTYMVAPMVGTTVTSSEYGWNVSVYYIDPASKMILLKNEPMIGEIVNLNKAWSSMVMSVDTTANNGNGEIVVKHLLYSDDVGEISGVDEGGQFFLTAVDLNAGTYTVDYNGEVVGKTLVFKVTIVSITPA